jgi:hypothetical protein
MVTVDDWRQGTDCPLGVVDDGVNGGVADDVEIFAQMLVFLFMGVSINRINPWPVSVIPRKRTLIPRRSVLSSGSKAQT